MAVPTMSVNLKNLQFEELTENPVKKLHSKSAGNSTKNTALSATRVLGTKTSTDKSKVFLMADDE